MSIPGPDGEDSPQQLAMGKRESTGTFAVRDGPNATATVLFDYSKVRGDPGEGTERGQSGAGLSCPSLPAAPGRLQVLEAPRLLHHPPGQGQLAGAGRCHRELPAPAGERWPHLWEGLEPRWARLSAPGNVGLGVCHL